jgi:hypothetical protein
LVRAEAVIDGHERSASMPVVKVYLWYVIYGALFFTFAWLMFEFFMHGQWKLALLFIACTPLCLGGFLMALIAGWQEADKWKIKKLMTAYSVVLLACVLSYSNGWYKYLTTPPEEPAKKGKKRPGIEMPKAAPGAVPAPKPR